MDWMNPWVVGIGVMVIGAIGNLVWMRFNGKKDRTPGRTAILAKGKIKGLTLSGNQFLGFDQAVVLEKGGEDVTAKDNTFE